MIINNWTNLKARRKKREKQIPTTFDERKTKCKRVCELRVRAFTWLRATNEVSCVIPEAMVLSTRCAREGGGGERAPEGSMWFGRVDAPPFSRPPLPPPPLPKPLFVGSSAHLQRRGWRGWFYWSRLTTPSTPSHHAYAPPLLPRRAREHAGASAGARHRRPPSHRPYKAITKLGVARWLIELDKSWRHRFSSLDLGG